VSTTSDTAADSPVDRELAIRCSSDRAFAIFTAQVGKWWPNEFTGSGVNLADAVIEPNVGGRVDEVNDHGGEYDWGSVRIWEPRHRVVLTWTLGLSSVTPTEVDAEISGDADACVMRLQHRGSGPDWAKDRPKFDSARGWDVVLGAYRSYAEADPGPAAPAGQ
jgi:uncharacterized protein YndB with AHSA1/START domain